MSDFDQAAAVPPEAVHMLSDPDSGLEGVIVLHSTRLGPAAGGCRFWTYPGPQEMRRDALRLAEGMAYKNAMADLPLGGGKAVIRAPEGGFDRARLFAAFGRAVDRLRGTYVTAEDAGTGVTDMQAVSGATRHVAGLAASEGRPGGDPSPWTALGVFLAMQEAARRKLGTGLDGLTVAVQGLGHVGSALCALLHEAGARLIVSEPRSDVAAHVACRYGAMISHPQMIVEAKCDVFAPCALGAVLNARSIPKLRAAIVCGAANNVLASEEDGDRLAERGVLYAPDYVVNAGGIINVCAEYLGWSQEEVETRVRSTGDRLAAVLDHAERSATAPHRAADALARRRIAAVHPRAHSRAA
ncbi:amino acid dehydrogenase [Pacificimonas flava]|uniref:Amino acid dehydrogenase n=2 Tax=Pacificimonas TaxID=1960290 RepID=A0A219B319_9SPHN|nr:MULTISPECIES: Glu/Leu/Phe/Val dehydrogenase dimerization domain-containing protein [Pacificimonas]MBZ6377581.1 Glu/Leu/Phe/Val dehydrogenase [Pacificimonas aurantium]OWV32727.1 amino acid dehydrogenase [Pacificimonas flava]